MTTALQAKDEEIMTDFQFKALMAMILEIAEKSESLEEVKKTLRKLASGQLDTKPAAEKEEK
jgi:hypothetical protein